jgi:hypothetical protein
MLRLFIVQDVFQPLVKVSSTDSVNIVVDQLIKCLSEISIGFLDELSFFSLDGRPAGYGRATVENQMHRGLDWLWAH